MTDIKTVSLALDVTAGNTYSWCRCGLSQTLPLCDGSHKTTTVSPLTFAAEKSTRVYLCSCHKTQDAPYCDGLSCDNSF